MRRDGFWTGVGWLWLATGAMLALPPGCGWILGLDDREIVERAPNTGDAGASGAGGDLASTGGVRSAGSGGTSEGGRGGRGSGGRGGDVGGLGPAGSAGMLGAAGDAGAAGSAGGYLVPRSPPAYTLDNCAGFSEGIDFAPEPPVLDSGVGAFRDESDWLDGWSNFHYSRSGLPNASQLELAEFPAAGDRVLDSAVSYLLSRLVVVRSGETLVIPAGTHIFATEQGGLVVARGGRIEAKGSKEAPIVFTSAEDEGDKWWRQWLGIYVLGRATNSGGNDVLAPGLEDQDWAYYGGDDDDDDSGELSYVRIEFSGANEVPALSLASVGSKTRLHHVMATSASRCFHWLGGTVSANHIACESPEREMFRADQGYRGRWSVVFGDAELNHWVGMRWTSDPDGAEPVTRVELDRATLCGQVGEEQEAEPTQYALSVERATGSIDHLVASFFSVAVDMIGPSGTVDDPKVSIRRSIVFGMGHHPIAADEPWPCQLFGEQDCDDDEGFNERSWFASDASNAFFDR